MITLDHYIAYFQTAYRQSNVIDLYFLKLLKVDQIKLE